MTAWTRITYQRSEMPFQFHISKNFHGLVTVRMASVAADFPLDCFEYLHSEGFGDLFLAAQRHDLFQFGFERVALHARRAVFDVSPDGGSPFDGQLTIKIDVQLPQGLLTVVVTMLDAPDVWVFGI